MGGFVLDSHKVHPYFSVRRQVPRALGHRKLRGLCTLRRSSDGPPKADQQALQMEEDTAIDNELRGLQFG